MNFRNWCFCYLISPLTIENVHENVYVSLHFVYLIRLVIVVAVFSPGGGLGIKKDICLPVSDRPKISENKGRFFFFFFCFVFFVDAQFCILKQKIDQSKMSEYMVTVTKKSILTR